MVGDSPFEGDDEEELFAEILRKKLKYPSRLSPEARGILDGFLVRDPNKRLGCGRNGREDIVKHSFFAGMDWDKLEKREVRSERLARLSPCPLTNVCRLLLRMFQRATMPNRQATLTLSLPRPAHS